eukprot:TRINITY_DN18015_c3_g1_i1.p1 TRINITY_DN18015_c3_g1~~TRINITY_DN18015_c3_g1_i1.p1  ORF type:complete len:245 (-),score=75.59 TRINITY_DN18015_c3_g1_i1:144-803(-)
MAADDEKMSEKDKEEMRSLVAELLQTDEGREKASEMLDRFARRAKLDWLAVMLECKADVNAVCEESDSTPLQTAASFAETTELPVVKFLLEHGANPNTPATDGSTALFCATEKGQVSHMLQLLEAKADIDHKAKDGRTALFSAVEIAGAGSKDSSDTTGASYDPLKLLISARADPKLKDKGGKTALDVAKDLKKDGAVDVLESVDSADWVAWAIRSSVA